MTWSRPALALAVLAILPTTARAADPPLGPASIPAGHYELDKRHASLTATVRHQGVSNYVLRFDTMAASFDYDPAHPEATHLTASVDPASLDVNGDWAKEFSEKFLKASKFPTATFTSTSVQALGGPQGTVSGDLTLMGVTKPITFNVTLIGSAKEPFPPIVGPRAVGIEAVATIKRSDFGSSYVQGMVGDDVTLTIEGEFDKK
ncbi:MAG TPA: YceI family protein [Caulobacteraceae bacterium]|jgi:polyisoprenoid-binding protein YceI|nr:YceI family protein [Caulobacteraceae bacterium]